MLRNTSVAVSFTGRVSPIEHRVISNRSAQNTRKRLTVLIRPTQMAIVIKGSARRILARCHRSWEGPPPGPTRCRQSFETRFGDNAPWTGWRPPFGPEHHRHPAHAALVGSNYSCHRQLSRRVGRIGTVYSNRRRVRILGHDQEGGKHLLCDLEVAGDKIHDRLTPHVQSLWSNPASGQGFFFFQGQPWRRDGETNDPKACVPGSSGDGANEH
ncbi:hypothetical protein BDM02DRAFT_595955 [Thelephora ganbajun]|uniref:Uncharacterized protein n=1 Tax=Thelephora ganbajun TaxID=370292 RepID=A0ACB6Z6X6_THEGA|nr:hypothetical protein BDM02DRAFT_595955 [Thelephora ganbajun]